MSYPLDLDEYSTERLRKELAHRRKLRREGKCDYCLRDPSTPSCKFPDRHKAGPERKEPLLLRFLKYLRDHDRKPSVLAEHEMLDLIKNFRKTR